MKILRLTHSNDTVHQGPGARVDLISSLGEERLGEPVEVVSRTVWPDVRLAGAVEKWILKEEPDLVWVALPNFWFEYLSVPKRLERKFGRAGKLASEAGFKAAGNPVISNNFAFRMARRILLKTVGGDPHFTPGALGETIEAVARVALRNEARQFVVWGPFSYTNYGATKHQVRDQLRWRKELIARVKALAEELHFAYEAPERPYWQTHPGTRLHRDQFHVGAEEQRGFAEREVDFLVELAARDGKQA